MLWPLLRAGGFISFSSGLPVVSRCEVSKPWIVRDRCIHVSTVYLPVVSEQAEVVSFRIFEVSFGTEFRGGVSEHGPGQFRIRTWSVSVLRHVSLRRRPARIRLKLPTSPPKLTDPRPVQDLWIHLSPACLLGVYLSLPL